MKVNTTTPMEREHSTTEEVVSNAPFLTTAYIILFCNGSL